MTDRRVCTKDPIDFVLSVWSHLTAMPMKHTTPLNLSSASWNSVYLVLQTRAAITESIRNCQNKVWSRWLTNNGFQDFSSLKCFSLVPTRHGLCHQHHPFCLSQITELNLSHSVVLYVPTRPNDDTVNGGTLKLSSHLRQPILFFLWVS